jgi:acetyl-CoA acyltransferase
VNEAVVIDVVRTPIGRGKAAGALAGVHPVDLLARTMRSLVERNDLDADVVEDVIVGCVGQAREQASNVGRSAVFAAGFPEHVPATVVERQCGSSQQAAAFAAQGVISGFYDVVLACGVESMSRVPMRTARMDADPYGPGVHARYPDGFVHQGISAELIAARWNLSRAEQDDFALRSQSLAAAARDSGALGREIVSVPIPEAGERTRVVELDEGVRETTAGGLAGLRPAFEDARYSTQFPQIRWSVTAGNSSQISDGASAALVTSRAAADRLGLRPRARLVSFAVIGDDPLYKLTGIIPATAMVLKRAGLSLSDIGCFEVNEAFASVVLAWMKELGVPIEKVNVNGGAIALGHPLGASGGRLLGTLVNALETTGERYGLQVMCEGGGMANATIIERCE